ncbi:MAG: SUMF1/EgtB/PvdO family nonheme iron enzyme [Magnetococcus sp. MYC-9]
MSPMPDGLTNSLGEFIDKALRTARTIRHPLLRELLQRLAGEADTLQERVMEPSERDWAPCQVGMGLFHAFLQQMRPCDDWLTLHIDREREKLTTTIRRMEADLTELHSQYNGLCLKDRLGVVEWLFASHRQRVEEAFRAEKRRLEEQIQRLLSDLSPLQVDLRRIDREEQSVIRQLARVSLEEMVWELSARPPFGILKRGFLGGDAWSCPLTGMPYMWVPGGLFQMGDLFGSGHEEEHPVHAVRVDGFWIGKYPVTQGEWYKVMGNNPAHFRKGERYPVENISWDDAQGFVRQLNRLGDGMYRLPTEAEWEYACRSGGKKELYAGGDEVNQVAWCSALHDSTHPVGQKAPNGLGLYDMCGNVAEWVQDCKAAYPEAAQENPVDNVGSAERVNRGGSWFSQAFFVRSSFRNANTPEFRSYALGLRMARAAPT